MGRASGSSGLSGLVLGFAFGFAAGAGAALFPSMGPEWAFVSATSGSLTCVPTSGFVITMRLDTLSPESGSVSGLVEVVTRPRPTWLCFRALSGELDSTIFFGATEILAWTGAFAGGVPTISGAIAPGLASGTGSRAASITGAGFGIPFRGGASRPDGLFHL